MHVDGAAPGALILDWSTVAPAGAQPPEGAYACGQCAFRAATYKQLRLHEAQVHQLRRAGWYYAGGSVCQACMKDYHLRWRLVGHLTRPEGRACLAALTTALFCSTLPQTTDNRHARS